MAATAASTTGDSDFVAHAEITIDAPPDKVWKAMTEPASAKEMMFGADVETDWKVGSPITWKGEWEGKQFEDKGKVLEFSPNRALRTTHYNPTSGKPDKPENYHEVAYVLTERDGKTRVVCTQNNNPTREAADHSTKNWKMALENLKKIAER